MKASQIAVSRRYQAALRAHLKQGGLAGLELARGLGDLALAEGLQTLDLARLHEHAMVTELLPKCPKVRRAGLIKRAGIFFANAILSHGKTRHGTRAVDARSQESLETLSRRTVELAASNLELSAEIAQCRSAESALKQSKRHYSDLLSKSDRMHKKMQRLSRCLLSAQEEERKNLSRELHDVIAQTLTGINIRLATLKKESGFSTRDFERRISRTQKLVEESVRIVHRFARELRPAVLDDLGLIPALHSFMTAFTARTGIRAHLTAFAGVEDLDIGRRTVLYRVAQEAMTNVARHAGATRVHVSIQKETRGVLMRIEDNGKSFDVDWFLHAPGRKCLGILGMRERLEMVNGRFSVESTPGNGTIIAAKMPAGKAAARTQSVSAKRAVART